MESGPDRIHQLVLFDKVSATLDQAGQNLECFGRQGDRAFLFALTRRLGQVKAKGSELIDLRRVGVHFLT